MGLYVGLCFEDRLLDIIDLRKNRKWNKLKIESIDGVVVIEIFKCSFIT